MVFGNHQTRHTLVLPSGRTVEAARVLYNDAARRVAAAEGAGWFDLSAELHVPGAAWWDLVCEDGGHLSPLGCHAYARFAANVIVNAMRDENP